MMDHKIIYHDQLLEISDDSILLKNYSFPFMRSKEIPFSAIEKIEVKEPTLWSGKWRFFGTGDLRTWFPLDNSRNIRDKIFHLTLKHQWFRIGFTAVDSAVIERTFRQKGLLK